MGSPHGWLGLEFTELLPTLRKETRRIELALTRPFGHSIGGGALRVVRVQDVADKLHILLAYECYHSPPRKKDKQAGSKER